MRGILHITLHVAPRVQNETRTLEFLRAQNAWFEALLERLEHAASDPEGIDAFIADAATLNEERARYDREAAEIRMGWNGISGTIPEATRAQVDALARRGETLVGEIQAAYARIIRNVEAQADDTRTALHTLFHGRNIVRRYAFDTPDDASYVDHKA